MSAAMAASMEQLTPQMHYSKDEARENDSFAANSAAADLTSVFTFESERCVSSSSSSSNVSPLYIGVASTPIGKANLPSSSFMRSHIENTPITASKGVTGDYKTPKGASLLKILKGDLCAVCLSPLVKEERQRDCSADCGSDSLRDSSNCDVLGSEDNKGLCETKCKHCFHKKCLDSAKAMKAECPLCRFELTPPEGTSKFLAPAAVRSAITSAATRARNAVRAAISMRNNSNDNTTRGEESSAEQTQS